MSLCTSCSACTGDIKELDERVYCYGKCLGIFHIKCAKIKSSVFKAITENTKNLKYLCNKCSNDYFGQIFEKLSELMRSMKDRDDCIKNKQTV
jgi:hypothetical protein